MNRRRFSPPVVFVLAVTLLASLPACSHLPFRRHKEDPAVSEAAATHLKTNAQGLAVEIRTSPDPLKLGEVRQVDVTVILRNTSKQPVHLNFPTGQTIEILLREPNSGKVISKWSTDRVFNSESRYLLVNAQERLEFNEPVSARDLQAGKPYTVEAYFVGYDKELRASKALVPQP